MALQGIDYRPNIDQLKIFNNDQYQDAIENQLI